MKAPKGPPAPAPVTTPYGLKALVDATEQLAQQHVLSDVTGLVSHMAMHLHPLESWSKFMCHTGWVNPGKRIGLLDFVYKFPEGEGALNGTAINLLVYPIGGGNGEPLHADYQHPQAVLWMRLNAEQWGELECTYCSGKTAPWAEWAKEAANSFRAAWKVELEAGRLARLANPLAREETMAAVLRRLWQAEALQDITHNLGLDLVLIDDEEEAEQHSSCLEHTAKQVLLVTPWLAEQLKKRGAVADSVRGLPLWSRDNRDASFLEHVLQDITYEKFGQSVETQLASTHEE